MLTKEQKQQIIDEIADKMERQKSLVLTDFNGLKVSEIEDLRNQLREKGGEYKITKKTLISLAADKAKQNLDLSGFNSSVALVFSYEDEIAPFKLISKFAKKHENLKILGGLMEGKLLNVEEVTQLAKLLSREELLAKVVGSLKAPVSRLVNVFQGGTRDLVGIFSAIVNK